MNRDDHIKSPLNPNRLAFRRFVRNKFALAGLIFIALAVLAAIFAYTFIPDKTQWANQQMIELKLLKPGATARVLVFRNNTGVRPRPGWIAAFRGQRLLYRYIPLIDYQVRDGQLRITRYIGFPDRGPVEQYALADILYPLGTVARKPDGRVVVHTLDGKEITTTLTELENEVTGRHIRKIRFWLGTDALGRDFLSRLVLGIRVSMAVGLMAVLISLVIGVVLGSLAGYFRGKVDLVIMYVINVFWSVPTLLLALSLALVMKNGLTQVYLAIGLTMWIEVARIVRGQFLLFREMDFVKAARAMAIPRWRIIFRHILPNLTGPLVVVIASNFAAAILLEAGLSFLGLGVARPMPSLGMMLNDHKTYLIAGLPHLALLPGILISLLVLAFFLLGNGLRDAFDVKSKSSLVEMQ